MSKALIAAARFGLRIGTLITLLAEMTVILLSANLTEPTEIGWDGSASVFSMVLLVASPSRRCTDDVAGIVRNAAISHFAEG
jgi:hypothetical protein